MDYFKLEESHDSLFLRLCEERLLATLKYSESLKLSELNKSADIINDHFIYDLESVEITAGAASTISFFASELFWMNFNRLNNLLSKFSFFDSTTFALRATNVSRLRLALENNNDINLSPALALMMALSSSKYKLYETDDNEIEFIKCLVKNMKPTSDWKLVKGFLLKRASHLRLSELSNQETAAGSRNALMVCGQLRGYKQSLPKLWKLVPDKANTDVFISTWKNPGAATIDTHRLDRRFDPEAIALIESPENNVDLAELKEFIDLEMPLLEEDSLILDLQNILAGAREIHINIQEDTVFPFNRMNNHEKMHYHNAYWIETLGKEKFLSDYTQMLKVRPDYHLSPTVEPVAMFDIPSLASEVDGWLLDVWGFGMGDQMFGGPTAVMTEIMSINFPKSLSTIIMLRIMQKNKLFMGHINLGLEAWSLGQKVARIPHRRHKFSEVEKIGSETIRKFLKRRIQ